MLRCPNMDGANFKNTLKILDFSKEMRNVSGGEDLYSCTWKGAR